MTTPTESARSARSRILAVGNRAMLEGSELVDRGVDFAANMFEAIGEIAASTAAEPIEMVIIEEPAASHPLEVIADSIHRLDPGVLVYLAVRPEAAGEVRRRAMAARFDGVLDLPVPSDSLEPFVTDPAVAGVRPPASAPRVDEAAEIEEVAEAITVDREFETARDEASAALASASRAPSVARVADTAGAVGSQSPQAGGLGDVDIVDAMLDDPALGVETALKLIEQETGWRDVQFVSGDNASMEELCTSGSAAVVTLRDRRYGCLVAAGVSSRALDPWAAWLARWAALAASQRELANAARCDALTGAGNRRDFDEFLPSVLDEARQKRRQIPLMVFDVDNLKLFNDRHGHEAGDTVLRETVRLLRSIIRKGDRVFRIGGDEFVVVFADPEPPRKPGSGVIESVETIARRFQTEICAMNFPKLGPEAPGTLSISAGLATFPWDGGDAETLLRVADQLALDSKRGGKNALTIGPGAAALCDQPPSARE
jgi:diguanylate cyclase (GGDEF)-like protein